MQTVFHHGKVYVESGHFEQAVLVEDGLIKAVGKDSDILPLAKEGCEKIDLGAKVMLPGFNDSHQHVYYTGQNLLSVPLLGATSVQDVIARGKAFLAEHPLKPGEVLTGQGWNQDYFTDEDRFIDRRDLDQISADLPIIFDRACGHVVSCNTKALELAGITEQTPQPAGGVFDYGPDGKPNGVFKELASDLIKKIIPAPTAEYIETCIDMAMQHAARNGITSVQSMDVHDSFSHRLIYGAIMRLQEQGKLTARINEQVYFVVPEELDDYLNSDFYKSCGDTPYFKQGSIKTFIDGSLGGRTALMRRDYADLPGVRGVAAIDPQVYDRLVEVATRHGKQVVTHAIGDQAITIAIDGYAKVNEKGKNPLRHGVIHCQITDRTLVNYFQETGTLALVQPIFLHSDLHIANSRVGDDIAKTSYAFQTMRSIGVHVSLGTDCPVEDLNPFHNIYCAVARKDLNGKPEGGYYPGECLTVEQAVDAYTTESAYVTFEETVKGRIKEGYYADLVVLSDDIFTVPQEAIRDITAELTMMDGKITYRK